MSDGPFTHHRNAALALLNGRPKLAHKEAGFLGHVAVAGDVTPRQREWLLRLLSRHGLPSLADGGCHE
jgi:hypothetical protein